MAVHQQQAAESSALFLVLAELQKTLLEQVTVSKTQTNKQLWEQVTKTLATRGVQESSLPGTQHMQLNVKVQKMTPSSTSRVRQPQQVAGRSVGACTHTIPGEPSSTG